MVPPWRSQRETLDNTLNSVSSCDFCDEFSGGHSNAFTRRYGKMADRTIFDTGMFRVIPSLGQLVDGHLLVVPRRHFCAIADLPDRSVSELEILCDEVRLTLRRAYGDCVFFEHGIRGAGSGGCGIDHAHMHAVPVLGNGVLGILTEKFAGTAIRGLGDLKNRVGRKLPYLFFRDRLGQRFVFPVEHLPSQYMRKLIAESSGEAEWDWRNSSWEPDIISTVNRLAPLFSEAITALGR
jgi:diadenosine tetraphosphate (Ap4A) HIT family hydrolase